VAPIGEIIENPTAVMDTNEAASGAAHECLYVAGINETRLTLGAPELGVNGPLQHSLYPYKGIARTMRRSKYSTTSVHLFIARHTILLLEKLPIASPYNSNEFPK
jgi:hypothetical protein